MRIEGGISLETMIELERAVHITAMHVAVTGTEQVYIGDCYNRVLAEDAVSPMAMPPFARSPLDGYAYRAADNPSENNVLQLKVTGEIPAGMWPEQEVKPGEAVRIYTGAPVPQGATCVVRMEDTEEQGGQVLIYKPVASGGNIVARGEEIKEAEVLYGAGTLLPPPAVGLLAAAGIEQVQVYRQPVVGLISTGSELMDVGQPLVAGKIYNSNSYTLRSLLLGLGCKVKVVPFVADNLTETVKALEDMADTDLVISTGGASVGKYDLMRDALEQLGCRLLFWKIDMKPGTPVSVGLHESGRLYFSLSGNPAAAVVAFEVLIRPLLRKCMGLQQWEDVEFPVRMAGGFAKGGRQRRFLRADAVLREGQIWADLARAQGSGILRSMIGSRLLVDVPAGHGPVVEGELLNARWI